MNLPDRIIDQFYFDRDPQKLVLSCPQCMYGMNSTIDDIKINNRLVCPRCNTVREIDVEDLFNRRELILRASGKVKF